MPAGWCPRATIRPGMAACGRPARPTGRTPPVTPAPGHAPVDTPAPYV
ncbi:hypothetical protein SXCC_03098 [Gluconacetobacter sp. SXCC-1]|nr:hypothetical protein SXCC_03098 [Gluconacetobacter sp. SXCC-1]